MSGLHILGEQIRTLYRQTETVLFANCVNAAIVSALLWTNASHPLLVSWLMAMAIVTAGRAVLSRAYRRRGAGASDASAWGRRYVFASTLSGTLWGAAGFLFLRDAPAVSQLIVVFFVGGMCSAAAGTLAAHLPAFVGFMSPALAGLALRLASFGDSLHQVLAAVIVLYGAGLFAVARVNHRALAEAFALRFENAELVASLSRAQRSLEQNNRTLELRVAERSEALRKQTEALRDAQRLEAIGRLAGGVAHDFNNLLTVILANISDLEGATRSPPQVTTDREGVPNARAPIWTDATGLRHQALVEHGGLDARARRALREIRDAASKGADVVRQLLTFSRRQRTTPETLDLNGALASMDRLLIRLLGERIRLELRLQPEPLFVHMDRTQTEQVIINLITNARDAMPDGGSVSISTQTIQLDERSGSAAPGSYALLRVSDTGIGMDGETRQRIFEPFFTTKEVGKGTGLGLSTAYGIVEQGRGHIQVSSEPGRGSSFSVYLPLADPASARSSPPPRLISGFRPITRAPGPASILLVEDEPTVRSVTRRILEKADHRVITAPNAEQALEIASNPALVLDLLVTDVVMAGLDGPSLAERLRAERAGLKILFISGYSRDHVLPEDVPRSIAFLPKPFTHDELVAKVTELLVEPDGARQAAGSEQ